MTGNGIDSIGIDFNSPNNHHRNNSYGSIEICILNTGEETINAEFNTNTCNERVLIS